MTDIELLPCLNNMQQYFQSGATREYEFRKQQLQKLREALYKYEEEIFEGLYTDLKKNREEAWITETAFVLNEIKTTLKNLRKWMKPERTPTNFFNFPSRSYIYKEPLGVVLIIGPWNYPLQLLLTPLVGAIAAGNCIVIKPSEFAPATAAVIKKIVDEIFPENFVLFVKGKGKDVIPSMMNNFRFDHVLFTGSTDVGRVIYEMAAKKLVPVTLELGGKSPAVVESDANIKVAAKRIAITTFSNAGQMCVAPDYILVHESVKEEFVTQMKSTITDFFSDDAVNNYNYGKIINHDHFHRLVNYLEQGDVIYGGKYDVEKQYIEPTLLDNIKDGAAIMQEEVFGPLLPIITYKTYDEAKAVIEKKADPLAFYVFTESSSKEEKWLRELSFGGGCVNNAAWHLTNHHLPFGGRGTSGIGAYHGKFSFDTFSHKKGIMKTPTWFDPSIKYPPYNGKLKLFKKFIG